MKMRYAADERTKMCSIRPWKSKTLAVAMGVHACGVIIAPGPVHNYVPV